MISYVSYPLGCKGRVVEGGRISLWVTNGDLTTIQTRYKEQFNKPLELVILCPRLPDINRKGLEEEAQRLGIKIEYQSGTAGWEILVPLLSEGEEFHGSSRDNSRDTISDISSIAPICSELDNLVEDEGQEEYQEPMVVDHSLRVVDINPVIENNPTKRGRGRPRIKVPQEIIIRIDQMLQEGKSVHAVFKVLTEEGHKVSVRAIIEQKNRIIEEDHSN